MTDLHCDTHRLPTDVLIPASTPRGERSTFMRARRFVVAALLLALALGASACARSRRCETVYLPFAWADGSASVWTVVVCDAGKVTVASSPFSSR